jgi:hypothetical protein
MLRITAPGDRADARLDGAKLSVAEENRFVGAE